MSEYWKRGEKLILSEHIGLSIQYVSDLTLGRRRASVDRAMELAEAAMECLGKDIPWQEWATATESEHQAFTNGVCDDGQSAMRKKKKRKRKLDVIWDEEPSQ